MFIFRGVVESLIHVSMTIPSIFSVTRTVIQTCTPIPPENERHLGTWKKNSTFGKGETSTQTCEFVGRLPPESSKAKVFPFQPFESMYTPVNQHSNGKSTIWVDVFPIENGDIPASYVSLPEGISYSKLVFFSSNSFVNLGGGKEIAHHQDWGRGALEVG